MGYVLSLRGSHGLAMHLTRKDHRGCWHGVFHPLINHYNDNDQRLNWTATLSGMPQPSGKGSTSHQVRYEDHVLLTVGIQPVDVYSLVRLTVIQTFCASCDGHVPSHEQEIPHQRVCRLPRARRPGSVADERVWPQPQNSGDPLTWETRSSDRK